MATTRTAGHFGREVIGKLSWMQALIGLVRSNRLLVKICTGLSLLLILFAWFDISEVLRKLLSIDARYVLLAIGLFVLQFALACLRWVFILGRQNTKLDMRAALSIYGVGTLANLFLVTSLAGMSVRAALLVRKGTGLSGALASLAAERIASITGLFLCGGAGLIFALPLLREQFGPFSLSLSLALAMAGLVFLVLTAGLIRRKFTALGDFLNQVWLAFSSLGAFLMLAAASTGVILLGFAGMAALALGMGLDISPVFFISVMPAIAFVSALPISVGGWGVREGMMVAGLSIFSIPADTAIALSISYGLGGLLVALLLGAVLSLIGQDSPEAQKT